MTSRSVRIDEQIMTGVLDANGDCEYVESRIRFTAQLDGMDRMHLMHSKPNQFRLYSFDVNEGGHLAILTGEDWMRAEARWRPLRRGEPHEVVWRAYPPPRTHGHRIEVQRPPFQQHKHLLCRLWVPIQLLAKVYVGLIDAWPPDINMEEIALGDVNFARYFKPLEASSNGLFAYEWKDLDIGFRYGILWLRGMKR